MLEHVLIKNKHDIDQRGWQNHVGLLRVGIFHMRDETRNADVFQDLHQASMTVLLVIVRTADFRQGFNRAGKCIHNVPPQFRVGHLPIAPVYQVGVHGVGDRFLFGLMLGRENMLPPSAPLSLPSGRYPKLRQHRRSGKRKLRERV